MSVFKVVTAPYALILESAKQCSWGTLWEFESRWYRLGMVVVISVACKLSTILCQFMAKFSFNGLSQSIDSCQSCCIKIFAGMIMPKGSNTFQDSWRTSRLVISCRELFKVDLLLKMWGYQTRYSRAYRGRLLHYLYLMCFPEMLDLVS